MNAVHLVCPSCSGINRVPESRLNENPSCGKCHQSIILKTPLDLDSNNFDKYISRNDLPVVVDFWAAWCGPCKMMAPTYSRLASEMSTKIRFAKLDTEQSQNISARFNIRSIPTMILFKQGKEIDRVSGALDYAGIKNWLESKVR